MESALITLKEEINKTNEAEHDLAKWKLVVTASLGAAAFGLFGAANRTNYWVLLVIPFVCAYIDLFKYQYELRILVIAQFLRENHGDTGILQRYELGCDANRRTQGTFSLGTLADITCSLGATLLAAALYILLNGTGQWMSQIGAVVIWFLGLAMIIAVRLHFGHTRRILEQKAARAQRMAA